MGTNLLWENINCGDFINCGRLSSLLWVVLNAICLQSPPPGGNSGQQQTPKEANRHQTTPTDGPRHPKRLFKEAWRLLLTLNGICWCLFVSFGVWRRLLVSYGVWRCEEGVWGASERVSECCLWTCLRFGLLRRNIWVFRACLVQLALYWKISERQKFTLLAFLKHENTKTSQ